MKISNCELLLAQFGLWTRQEAMVTGYRSPTLALMQRMEPAHTDAAISDERAMQIDQLLVGLARDEPEIFKALSIYYCHGRTVRETASMMGVSKDRASDLIRLGTASVASSLRVVDALAS